MITHIHIITLSGNDMCKDYMIRPLIKCWEEQGITVTTGPVKQLEADIGFLHVNATQVPVEYLPKNPLGRPILNGRALDISKRRISANILTPETDYTGPVIIKTNANYYGKTEISKIPPWSLKRCRQKLAGKLPWQLVRELPRLHYPILASVSSIPSWVWQRDDLVVERFLPEIENGEYVLRMWLFLGDREYGAKLYSHQPVIKVSNMNRYEYLNSVPDSLRTARAALGMDYGKFDYVMNNGEAVLLDANTTPTIASSATPSRNLLNLASGLQNFVTGSQ